MSSALPARPTIGNRRRRERLQWRWSHRPFDGILMPRGGEGSDRRSGCGLQQKRPQRRRSRSAGLSRGMCRRLRRQRRRSAAGRREMLRISERMRSGSATTRLGNSTMRALKLCRNSTAASTERTLVKIERAKRHRGDCKNRAEALEAAKDLFFDRQFERIEFNCSLEQGHSPDIAGQVFFQSADHIGRSGAWFVKMFLVKQGKHAWLF